VEEENGAHREEDPMKKPKWTYCASIYLPKKHCLLYRDEGLGVQLQVMTPANRVLFPLKEREYYFIDGVERTFRSEDELMRYHHLASPRGAPATHPLVAQWRKVAYSLNLL
jgi:hypothetical protein